MAARMPWDGSSVPVGPEILPFEIRERVEAACRTLLSALELIYKRFTPTEFCRVVDEVHAHRSPVLTVPHVHWAAIARADFVMTEGEPHIVEINIHSNAGGFGTHELLMDAQQPIAPWLYGHGVHSAVVDHPGRRLAEYIATILSAQGSTLLAIAYPEDELGPDGPHKGYHYLALAKLVRELGYDVVCIPVERLVIRNKGAWVGQRRVGVVYRHFPAEYGSPSAAVGRLLRCAAEGRVGLVTPFLGDLLMAKALLVHVLQADALAHLGATGSGLLQRYVAPTRIVSEGERDELVQGKDGFVLKRSRGFGGHDVVIGIDVSMGRWVEEIERAVLSNDTWVMQKFFSPDQTYSLRRCEDGRETVDDGPTVYGAMMLQGTLVGVMKRQYSSGKRHNVNGDGGSRLNPVIWSREHATNDLICDPISG